MPSTPTELVLEISATATGKLEVYPRGLWGNELPFLLDPILSAADAPPVEAPDALGVAYYQALFAEQPALKAWLEARIAAGTGRLIFSMTPETLLEQWETLTTPNKRLVVLQGIGIERRLTEVSPPPGRASQPAAILRALWVTPLQPSTEDSGARRMQRLFDEGMVTCQPPTQQEMLRTLAAARDDGQPFQVVHLEGQGFYTFRNEHGAPELWFKNPHGGGIVADVERLREVLSGLPLVVLEDYPMVGTDGLQYVWPTVVPQLLGLGVRAVIVVPFSKETGQAARFIDRLYDELGKGETIGQAVSDGRRALLIEPAQRPSVINLPVELKGGTTVQLYQQGDDIALVHSSRAASSSRHSAIAARSMISTDSAHRPAASVVPSPSLRFFLPYAVLGLVLALGGGAWMLRNHIRAADQRKAQAAEQHRTEMELAAERSRIEEAAKSCLNPNAFRCAEVLLFVEDCRQKRRPGLWPMCSYWVGRIWEGGLAGERGPGRALEAYKQGCDGGYGLACLNLGHMKEHGQGLRQPELLQARGEYERGCKLGNLEACANAAWQYATDDVAHGLTQDIPKARELYQQALAGNGGQGIPRANAGLGTLRLEQDRDTAEAYRLFDLACSQGDPFGCKQQGTLASTVGKQQELYEKACRFTNNRPEACSGCISLAKLYEKEPGREQAAFSIYEKLCSTGCENGGGLAPACCEDIELRGQACRWLGWSLEHGDAMHPVNKPAARLAYRQGCDFRDQRSCKLLERLAEPSSAGVPAGKRF